MSEHICLVCSSDCQEQSLYGENMSTNDGDLFLTPEFIDSCFPAILILSLAFNPLNELPSSDAKLIDQIKTKKFHLSTTFDDAADYLEQQVPRAILVTDEGITRDENETIVDLIRAYVVNGGRVIFGLAFPRYFAIKLIEGEGEDRFNYFFGEKWGLTWRLGSTLRQDYEFEQGCVLPVGFEKKTFRRGIGRITTEVLGIEEAECHEWLYTPALERNTASVIDWTQMAIVGTRYGMGYLAYVGDLKGDKTCGELILKFLSKSGIFDERAGR